MANTHTPANDARLPDGTYRSDGDYRLSGKTLCGKPAGSLTLSTTRPTCGQCLRNLGTVTGMLRDGRSLLAEILKLAAGASRDIAVMVPKVDDPFTGIVDVPTNDGWDA